MKTGRHSIWLATFLLAGCVAEPSITGVEPGRTAEARATLTSAAKLGPVRIEVRDPPSGLSPDRLAALAAEGISGLTVRFATDAPALPSLVMSFADDDPERLCGGSRANSESPASPITLAVAFCDLVGTVAALSATAGGPNLRDAERLVWRSTARLFPDDYVDTYGFNLFGNRVRFGFGGSYGF